MPAGDPPEIEDLRRIAEAGRGHVEIRDLCRVRCGDREIPVTALSMGNRSPDVPAIAFVGGVHGLERIGMRVVLAFLESLVARLAWDDLLHRQLEHLRLVFLPVANPAGLWRGTRCNANGVDLMRNAPVGAVERVPYLFGGQRVSHHLPWYRGREGAAMEAEAEALCALVREELLGRAFSLSIDCHSGFGLVDRIWFPFAHTREPMAHLAEVHALMTLFDHAYPNHDYVFEPQCRQYFAHGDLWDHLYLARGADRVFLPLTLEMGSWRWIRKAPSQLLSRAGIFNPMAAHRHQRVLRRHLVWLDFLCRATASWHRWVPAGPVREQHDRTARHDWFGP